MIIVDNIIFLDNILVNFIDINMMEINTI